MIALPAIGQPDWDRLSDRNSTARRQSQMKASQKPTQGQFPLCWSLRGDSTETPARDPPPLVRPTNRHTSDEPMGAEEGHGLQLSPAAVITVGLGQKGAVA